MDPDQLRELVVRPTLEHFDLWSEAAENLVVGTAAQESNFRYLRQLPNGPALGLWQCEPETFASMLRNYFHFRAELREKVCAWCDVSALRAEALIYNLRLGAIVCRLHYRRIPEPLPDAEDLPALASYWDRHYNRNPEKGFPDEFVENYRRLVE